MPEILPSLILITVLATIAIVVLGSRSFKVFPPGPPRKFLVGNAFQIPKESPWIKFTEWAAIYGDLVYARVFTRRLIIINSYQLALRVLDSEKYSDRPRRRLAELSGFDKTILFMNYGDEVRKSRKLIHAGTGPRELQAYHETHTKEARIFAKCLLDDPSRFLDHLRRTVTGSFLQLSYGHKIESDDDILVHLGEQVMNITAELVSPNKYAVDIFPMLNLLPEGWPGTNFKRIARRNRDAINGLMGPPFLDVVEQMKNGMAKPSFTSNHLEGRLHAMSDSELERLKWAAGIINAAGLDTTASVVSGFFLAMARYPDIQAKAQKELDTVLGTDVLPTFADQARLPYIDCIIQETIRWQTPIPLIARSLRSDDIVDNFAIPAGSFVMANVWAFTHDPELYPDPLAFNPDRFLPNKSTIPPDPRLYTFGFGRRGCPGNNLANNVIYIMIATTLALFKILPEVDADGKLKVPEANFTTTTIRHPVPFRCQIVPRSPESAKLTTYAADL